MFARVLETVLKLQLRFLLVLSVAVGCLLFLPDDVAEKMALRQFREQYRTYIGPSFLLVASLLIVQAAFHVLQTLRDKIRRARAKKVREMALESLTPEEQGYLAALVVDSKNTIYVNIGDGVAGGLEAKGILYRSTNMFDPLEGIPHNLQPWARKTLTERPDLLDKASGRPVPPGER